MLYQWATETSVVIRAVTKFICDTRHAYCKKRHFGKQTSKRMTYTIETQLFDTTSVTTQPHPLPHSWQLKNISSRPHHHRRIKILLQLHTKLSLPRFLDHFYKGGEGGDCFCLQNPLTLAVPHGDVLYKKFKLYITTIANFFIPKVATNRHEESRRQVGVLSWYYHLRSSLLDLLCGRA